MAGRRVRLGFTAGLLAVLLVAGGLTPLPRSVYTLDAVLMVLAYGVPSWWLGRPADVIRMWPALLVWVLVLTLLWDMVGGAMAGRRFLSEWWLVYPSSLLFFSALYLFHGWAVHLIVSRSPHGAGPSSPP